MPMINNQLDIAEFLIELAGKPNARALLIGGLTGLLTEVRYTGKTVKELWGEGNWTVKHEWGRDGTTRPNRRS